MAHRLKNQYAVLFAITRSIRKEADSAADFDQLLTEKLRGLASSHDLLVAGNWGGASMRELVNAHLLPFCSSERFRMTGADLRLDARKVQYLGMALHELATNAIKHGALSHEDGRIDIAWKENGEGFSLIWREYSGRHTTQGPVGEGFGYKVLTLLVPAALDGTAKLETLPDGLRWTINLPNPGEKSAG
jgi:two-component sensor histidine kinase